MKSIERILLSSMPTAGVMFPSGGRILGAGCAHDDRGDLPFLLVLADVDAPRVERTFWVLGNGPHAPADATGYVGSVTTSDNYDMHIFDGSVALTD